MNTDTPVPTPTISRLCADGTMIELLYDADLAITSLAVCRPSGKVSIETQVDLSTGERLVSYAPTNNLFTSGCVLLPSEVGTFDDKAELLEQVRAFIHHYVDLSPLYEDIAAHYVLLTWVHDAFNELPYLRFRGDFGTGKTRALLAIGSISYKPFFASGASTVSPIFHILDEFGGTLILDEADLRFSDATADLSKILNNGNMKGLPVLRTMTNRNRELNPRAFKVFGPKIVGMRESFADRALESRFLTENTGGRPLRPDISIYLPDAMKTDAQALRNQLLAWRFAARHTVGIDPNRLIAGVSPRANQITLPLLSLIDDGDLRDRIAAELVAEEARVSSERASIPDIAVLAAITEAAAVSPTAHIAVADIARRVSRKNSGSFENSFTPKAVGSIVRTKLRLPTVKSNGVYVIPNTARPAIAALATRHGLSADATDSTNATARGFVARSAKNARGA
ncbi:hypothetical protein GCM10009087_40340 [Sphingomonas oligophenolica]|uniref:DUF3631 domain-containing protein n=1 Tax=Sphingomonas oligophenolica TaxID=301154 RepID=A0ABU9Y233_9SPHN